MNGDPHERLHELVDLDDTAALLVDSLSPDEADQLLRQVERADLDLAAELDAALDAALDTGMSAVPRVVRSQVRRVLRGRR